jgi:3-oxoacyl-[acyl-carrier protein] reductase
MELGLKGKVAIVTGGARGIGRAVVEALLAEDVKVVIADVDHKEGEKLAKRFSGQGAQCRFRRVDVSSRSDVQRLVDYTTGEFDGLHILVNNAGIASLSSIDDLTDDAWDRIMNVNMKGTLYCCQTALRVFKRQCQGAIVNVSSSVIKTGGSSLYAHYVASKCAIWGFTVRLAREAAPFGIRANGVAPGAIDTDLMNNLLPPDRRAEAVRAIPLGRLGRPSEVASAIVFLVSDAASYVTGELFDVNGGQVMD